MGLLFGVGVFVIVFGLFGVGNFMIKIIIILVIIFFVLSIVLGNLIVG